MKTAGFHSPVPRLAHTPSEPSERYLNSPAETPGFVFVIFHVIIQHMDIREKIKMAVEKNPYKKDIRRLSLFGSELHGTAKEGSDVDLLVEFMPGAEITFFSLAEIEEDFERNIGRKVDLLTPRQLSHYFRDSVLAEAELLYQS